LILTDLAPQVVIKRREDSARYLDLIRQDYMFERQRVTSLRRTSS